MDAELFLRDLEDKPERLRSLADGLDAAPVWGAVPPGTRRVVLLGMGSSRYAAAVIAARLRASGVHAVAEYASAVAATPGGAGTVAIGISASGKTEETTAALRRHRDAGSAAIALTNAPASAIAVAGTGLLDLMAGPEQGGVACRSFQHTLALLLALEDRLLGHDISRVPSVLRRAADATEDLLARRDTWLSAVGDLLTASGQPFLLAPHERLSSAEQGALVLRQGPRLPACACETADWLHVDVYLTKSLDYRALLFAGSGFDDEAMGWMRDRGATVVAVGGDIADAKATIRYPGDDDPEVALLTEVLVPELVAADVWGRG
ncbi:MAG TPA: SIS domain-containing protein [Actinomycetota bacterium]|nr:SIS domain-containing protein [Actinomycetota bacterium]